MVTFNILRKQQTVFPSGCILQPHQQSICCLVTQSCPTLCDPIGYVAHQAPLCMGFSRPEYWSGLPCLFSKQSIRVWISPHPGPQLLVSVFFILAILVILCEVYLTAALILHFPNG